MRQKNKTTKNVSLSHLGSAIKSLCPVLGEVHLELNLGVCPSTYQNPFGKILKTCSFGVAPFTRWNESAGIHTSGSEFHVLEIFQEKFNFSSNVTLMESFPESVCNHWCQ